MSQKTFTNSTCLIGLERIGHLDLLPQIFVIVYAPSMVAAEVRTELNWLTVKSIQKGVISEIKPLLTALTQADFRISEKIVQQALYLVGESD